METGDASPEGGGGGGDVERGIINADDDRPRSKDQVKTSTKEGHQQQQQVATRDPPAVMQSPTSTAAPTTTPATPTSSPPLVSADAVPVENAGVTADDNEEDKDESFCCQCVFHVKRYKVYWALSILLTNLILAAIIIGSSCGTGHCTDSSSSAAACSTTTTNLESSTPSPTMLTTATGSPDASVPVGVPTLAPTTPAPSAQASTVPGWVLSDPGESCDVTCAAAGGACNAAGNEQVDDATKVQFVAEDMLGLTCAGTDGNTCNYSPYFLPGYSYCYFLSVESLFIQ